MISYEVSKTNLPPEHQQMHKFTEVASGEREKTKFMLLTTLFVRTIKVMKKSNLHAEHKQMHKFTEVAS